MITNEFGYNKSYNTNYEYSTFCKHLPKIQNICEKKQFLNYHISNIHLSPYHSSKIPSNYSVRWKPQLSPWGYGPWVAFPYANLFCKLIATLLLKPICLANLLSNSEFFSWNTMQCQMVLFYNLFRNSKKKLNLPIICIYLKESKICFNFYSRSYIWYDITLITVPSFVGFGSKLTKKWMRVYSLTLTYEKWILHDCGGDLSLNGVLYTFCNSVGCW